MNKDKQIKSTDWLTKGYTKEELATMKAEAIKEAEIEEMAKITCVSDKDCFMCPAQSPCYLKTSAKRLYEKGYRKASKVAEEIFAEIERLLDNHHSACLPVGEIEAYTYYEGGLGDAIAELKKKYAEDEG